jgi:putative flavoprotein involved in K+ transport
VLELASVVWATGFKPDFGWIELPVFGENGYPLQYRGVVDAAPGLYFLELPFQHTFASAVVGGVGNDACYITEHIAERTTWREKKPTGKEVVGWGRGILGHAKLHSSLPRS